MINKLDFTNIIHEWDVRFTPSLIEEAYVKFNPQLHTYALGIVDNADRDFYFDFLSTDHLRKMVSRWVNNYIENNHSYLPRILIINMSTGRVFIKPWEWGLFCDK